MKWKAQVADRCRRIQVGGVRWIENELKILLAGPTAEQIRAGADRFSEGSEDDLKNGVRLLDYLVGSKEALEAYLHLLEIQMRPGS